CTPSQKRGVYNTTHNAQKACRTILGLPCRGLGATGLNPFQNSKIKTQIVPSHSSTPLSPTLLKTVSFVYFGFRVAFWL
ncbi:hypothetical protein, partial [Thalassoglobus sp.]|uniref:hypothetical protein n=1 Tax=Thalassoglobus sp. TaxID=2795869 RepID=UPI003AA7D556